MRGTFLLDREPGQWYLIFKGVATENGYGNNIGASRAERIITAFRPPLTFAQVDTARFYDDAGFCQNCDAPYYYHHWHVRGRLRLLPPRPRQEPRPAVVTLCRGSAAMLKCRSNFWRRLRYLRSFR